MFYDMKNFASKMLLLLATTHLCYSNSSPDFFLSKTLVDITKRESQMKEQYSTDNILRYEEIFGDGFVTVGGLKRAKKMFSLLKLQAGQNVLDIGCGTGGACFYVADNYDVSALGIDCSEAMIQIAKERASRQNNGVLIDFQLADIVEKEFPEVSFDVIYSRDVLVHIFDKTKLFEKTFSWLKPGGKLLISDYCIGEGKLSEGIKTYITQRQYDMETLCRYKELLEQAGFSDVIAQDSTKEFVEELQDELKKLESIKEEYIRKYSREEYEKITTGWKNTIERCRSGEQRWGVFLATKSENWPFQIF
jgi:phosphoethanolamine N-methyltransferase